MSNEKRKQQTMAAAAKYVEQGFPDIFIAGFLYGAMWADSHPNSVEDELPQPPRKEDKMTIIINNCDGLYTKTWHNWDRNIVPQVGDILLFQFGDNNEITQQATVIARVFDGTRQDIVYLTTDYKKEGQNERD